MAKTREALHAVARKNWENMPELVQQQIKRLSKIAFCARRTAGQSLNSLMVTDGALKLDYARRNLT